MMILQEKILFECQQIEGGKQRAYYILTTFTTAALMTS